MCGHDLLCRKQAADHEWISVVNPLTVQDAACR